MGRKRQCVVSKSKEVGKEEAMAMVMPGEMAEDRRGGGVSDDNVSEIVVVIPK